MLRSGSRGDEAAYVYATSGLKWVATISLAWQAVAAAQIGDYSPPVHNRA